MQINQHISPNCGPRRNGLRPSLVVIHYTAMTSAAAAIIRLCDPVHEVSAHYVIARNGQVTQLVSEDQRAWHAGAGQWHGQDDINSRSIGIELDNTGTHPFPEPQMLALETLLVGVLDRWDISPEGVIGHSDMAPGRKFDPGPYFDWTRLAHQNLAAAAPATGIDPANIAASGIAAGYTATCDPIDLRHAIALRWPNLI
ncbi:N-acetylmuramoyl-L-alanine amidase [Pseudosulfitobacter sp. SM2401]